MTLPATNTLLIGATFMGGLVAGLSVNKVLVQMPAWGEVGTIPWAQFTRAADLGPGLFVYPTVGISALLLSVAGAIAVYFDRASSQAGAIAAYLAAAGAIAALIVTSRFLAPPTLSLQHMGDDPAALHEVFATVARYWRLKAGLHVLSFVANLWALVALTPAGQLR